MDNQTKKICFNAKVVEKEIIPDVKDTLEDH